MSRLDDLIDLIRTTNEVYFITAPNRVRTVFILVDDIVELALKSHLQEQALMERACCIDDLKAAGLATADKHEKSLALYFDEDLEIDDLPKRFGLNGPDAPTKLKLHLDKYSLLRHWSLIKPGSHVSFDDVVDEVKKLHPADAELLRLLDNSYKRHKLRNDFYHDPNKARLTVDDDECLRALRDLFLLMEALFPEFRRTLQNNKEYKTVRCQIGVLRLKLEARSSRELKEPYNEALQLLQKDFKPEAEIHEHNILHSISDRFYAALGDRFRQSISKLESRVDQIDRMRNMTAQQKGERDDKLRTITILKQQLADMDSLIGTT